MSAIYPSVNSIKVYPATNSPLDGSISTEYNVNSLSKSSRKSYILDVPTSVDNFNLTIGGDTPISASFVLDGYYVELFDKIVTSDGEADGKIIVFAVAQYSQNSTDEQIQIEKEHHMTGTNNSDLFEGVRFEICTLLEDTTLGIKFDPTDYNLPESSLPIAIYDHTTSLMSENMWAYSRLNTEDIALKNGKETSNSSKLPMTNSNGETVYPHTLAEYFENADGTFIRKFGDDIKYDKLAFKNTSNSTTSASIYSNDNELIVDTDEFNTPSTLGKVRITGDLVAHKVFNAVYNDYAELYEKDRPDEKIEPGDVIELNPTTGKYRKCQNSISSLVVGVYSDNYGHLLGGDADKSEKENLDKYIPVGIAGRVWVKVSNEMIAPGDLLVSSINGTADSIYNQKCDKYFDERGRIIGKALSTPTEGKVLMQIMLG